ncbi:MAG: hypothetical protein D4S02_06020 [Rhodocyclaceae bacterium]|nr:MAG: hypothetical protein D4S02_06020 [Rhodocyclaceae bacterium]
MEIFLICGGVVVILTMLGSIISRNSAQATVVRSGDPEWDGRSFKLDDPRIPAPIRERAKIYYQPGFRLFFTDTSYGGEWWLLDGENLIEAFWLTE